uniref:Reverse transcriptase domain-containing protein n=1 Tax=Tanacetum cinerariifolium TaxID=118510 RepID=A0A6L2KII7_TANCI|nr:reverse transcriptase domain-containing protein [Tanacetum cinerariifolium]
MQTRSSSRLVSDQSSNSTSSTYPNPKGHNRRRSKQRIVNSNLEEHSHHVVMMADRRTMAQLLQAPTEGYEDALVVPIIIADNFELNHGLLTLVKNKQFYGHDKEDPHAHIQQYQAFLGRSPNEAAMVASGVVNSRGLSGGGCRSWRVGGKVGCRDWREKEKGDEQCMFKSWVRGEGEDAIISPMGREYRLVPQDPESKSTPSRLRKKPVCFLKATSRYESRN